MLTGNGKKGGGGRRVPRSSRRVELPLIVMSFAFFFTAGFYTSAITSSGELKKVGHLHKITEEKIPGVPHGETGEPFASVIPRQILSWKPRVVYFPNFASAYQCEWIKFMARSQLTPSLLDLQEGETNESTQGIRTSTGTFIAASDDPTGILYEIERKMARVTMIPRENGEMFNILRYQIGQRYASHHDAFDPDERGSVGAQRIASFLLYLSDVAGGGETVFPYENGMNVSDDYYACVGLKVKPKRGDALLFYSVSANGTVDPLSLHGSCPVINGEKWVATKWITDRVIVHD